MKTKFFGIILAALAVLGGWYNYNSTSSLDIDIDELVLLNVEALADDEYVIGPIGTNWKEYRTQCTRVVGFDFVLKYEITTTYWTDVCGSGSGYCLSPAGC